MAKDKPDPDQQALWAGITGSPPPAEAETATPAAADPKAEKTRNVDRLEKGTGAAATPEIAPPLATPPAPPEGKHTKQVKPPTLAESLTEAAVWAAKRQIASAANIAATLRRQDLGRDLTDDELNAVKVAATKAYIAEQKRLKEKERGR